MDSFSIWHWLIVIVVLGFVVAGFRSRSSGRRNQHAKRAELGYAPPESPQGPSTSFRLKSWALRTAQLFGGIIFLVQIVKWLFRAASETLRSGETQQLVVETLVLVPIYWLAGLLVGALAYAVVRVFRGSAQVAKTAAPAAIGAAVAAGNAAANAVHFAKQSPLEKKLAELDRLHADGKITSEERAAARSAALTRH